MRHGYSKSGFDSGRAYAYLLRHHRAVRRLVGEGASGDRWTLYAQLLRRAEIDESVSRMDYEDRMRQAVARAIRDLRDKMQ